MFRDITRKLESNKRRASIRLFRLIKPEIRGTPIFSYLLTVVKLFQNLQKKILIFNLIFQTLKFEKNFSKFLALKSNSLPDVQYSRFNYAGIRII